MDDQEETRRVERGARLREERERLNVTQEFMANAGGVKILAHQNYEKGKRSPDAEYLSRVSALGVDVLYVLTGIHSSETPRLSSMKDGIQQVITNLSGILDKIP